MSLFAYIVHIKHNGNLWCTNEAQNSHKVCGAKRQREKTMNFVPHSGNKILSGIFVPHRGYVVLVGR